MADPGQQDGVDEATKEAVVAAVLAAQQRGQNFVELSKVNELPGVDHILVTKVTAAINELLADNVFKMVEVASVYHIALVSDEERARRERESDLSPDERLILSVISNAGRVGLWKKDISYKSRLHTNTVTKTLKRLESQRMVKTYKPYNNKTRKMYILFDLEPDNSGGWCYGEDKELDLGFLGVLEQVCLDQLRGGRTGAGQGPLGKLSVGTVTAEVNGSDLFNTPLEAKNIYQIMMTLVYDGHATVVNGLSENTSSRVDPYAAVTFKATGSAVDFDNSVTTTPCGTCPVMDQCTPGGYVSPESCVYMQEWLW